VFRLDSFCPECHAMKRAPLLASLVSCLLAALSGCSTPMNPAPGGAWHLTELGTMRGFRNPECAVVDPETGVVFVSSTDAASREAVNELDAKGFLSTLEPGGRAGVERWVDSNPVQLLNSPKGLCVLGGCVYLNDLTELKRCRIETAGPVEVVATFSPDVSLNDAVTDGRFVYVSDTPGGRVFRVDPATGKYLALKAPPRINGLTFRRGELIGVTAHRGDSDIWSIDKFGLLPPRRWRLGEHFTGLDGIEALDDGTLLISDVWGHRLYLVDPATKAVRALTVPVDHPADFGIDRSRGLVYVPQFFRDEVKVYQLTRGGE